MTPDYISINLDWTIAQVLDYVRLHGKDSETINVIYAVDDNNILVDDFKIRDFLLNSPEKKVKDIADGNFLSLSPYEKQEQAVNLFKKTNRVALPVVDQRGVLLGLVTIDDILNIAEEESTEDIQMIGGTEPLMFPI